MTDKLARCNVCGHLNVARERGGLYLPGDLCRHCGEPLARVGYDLVGDLTPEFLAMEARARNVLASDAALMLAHKYDLDIQTVKGTGQDDFISLADVDKALAAAAPELPPEPLAPKGGQEQPPAQPEQFGEVILQIAEQVAQRIMTDHVRAYHGFLDDLVNDDQDQQEVG